MDEKLEQPQKYTLSALAAELEIELWKAMEIVKHARTEMREELVEWLFGGNR
jgi:hypothetical protein